MMRNILGSVSRAACRRSAGIVTAISTGASKNPPQTSNDFRSIRRNATETNAPITISPIDHDDRGRSRGLERPSRLHQKTSRSPTVSAHDRRSRGSGSRW